MGESGHRIDSSVLEWSLWEVSSVIDYLVHMTESGLFSPVNKSRDVALIVQVLPVSGPTQSELALCYTVAKSLVGDCIVLRISKIQARSSPG